jgi:methionyl aminopeptidase
MKKHGNHNAGISPLIKTDSEIHLMEKASRIVADTLSMIKSHVKPGIKTIELDKIAEDFILSKGAKPAFKGYRGFPGTLCLSIDEEVVHGIPGERQLEEGMILSIDCGCQYQGYFGDSAVTYAVGEVSEEKLKLMKVTEEALMLGIENAISNNKVYDISKAVQTHVEDNGFSVTRDLVGHGVGRKLHEEPPVPNFVPPLLHRTQYPNLKLQKNMTLAIEPMVHAGVKEIRTLKDGWTVVTADHKPSAHFEHTVVIDDTKPIILTLRD